LHNYEGGHAKAIDQTYTLSFADVSIAGTWTLRIHDGFNVYHGVLNNWTLTVNYGDAATIPVTGISGSGDVY
jgi:subtilisin-like proprotein convertase family protein